MINLHKYVIAAGLLVTGSFCYAENPPEAKNAARQFQEKRDKDKDRGRDREKNKAIWDMHKKLFELKAFKWETIQQNLKIDIKTLAASINKKITDLGLNNAAFDALRASAKHNRERIEINKLENKFLHLQMMVTWMERGCQKKDHPDNPEQTQPETQAK